MVTYLIIGANGFVGAHLVHTLAAQSDTHIIAATRNPNAQDVRPNVEPRQLDLSDPSTFPSALEGVDRAFVLSPTGHSDATALVGPLFDAMEESGVEHVVLMTANGVQFDDSLPLRKLELQLEQSTMSCTILRPGWFMQNFQTYWLDGITKANKVWVPAAQSLTAFIDTRDVAESAAVALTNKTQGAYNLTGGQALTYGQAAEVLSAQLDRPLVYEDASPEAFAQQLRGLGFEEGYVQTMGFLFQSVRDGFAAEISDGVEVLMNKPARTLQEYTKDHANLF